MADDVRTRPDGPGSQASPSAAVPASSPVGADPSRDAIAAAIKATEYKYFGDYEMSDGQREAVDVLVSASLGFLTVTLPGSSMPKPKPCLDDPLRVASNMRQANLPGAAEALEWAEWQRQYAISWANRSVDSVKERMWAVEDGLRALVSYLAHTPHHNAPEAAAARKLLNRDSDGSGSTVGDSAGLADDEAMRIAAGLTKAQRNAVLFRGLALREGLCRSPNIATARVLHRQGIIDYPSYAAAFTPLGLRVRAALQNGGAGDE